MDLEPHETTPPRMDPFTVNWAYYRRLLNQAIPGNPSIMAVEEIDAVISSLLQ
jgi:hypothetical protein